jgi:hypothetical protein
VDGIPADEQTSVLTLAGSDYGIGNHRVLLTVYKGSAPYSKEIVVTIAEITLDRESLILTVGDTEGLTAAVSPGGLSQAVAWTSSNPSVASVANGTVTALKAGSALITAQDSFGGHSQCAVTVKPSASLDKADITVDMDLPVNELIGTSVSAASIKLTGSLTITAAGGYKFYQWAVDGIPADEQTSAFTLAGSDYGIGKHRVLITVYKGSVPYSKEITFTITE